ncbi:hypothetical protein Tco_1398498 [Tanacetum coccineum]
MINDTYGDKPFTPKPQPEDGGLSSNENLDEWLKTEMEKHMCGQDKENIEDALIAILKSLVGECKVVHTNKDAQIETYSNGTNKVQGVFFVANDEEGDIPGALPCQLPPKELNPWSFTLPCTIGSLNLEPSETMILGRPFLATIRAQIDVFKREIPLGIGEDRVKFDIDGGVCHSRIPIENVYMTNSVQDEEPFNPLEIGENLFSYESPTCLQFEQCTRFCDDESIGTIDSSDNMQEPDVEHKRVVNLKK